MKVDVFPTQIYRYRVEDSDTLREQVVDDARVTLARAEVEQGDAPAVAQRQVGPVLGVQLLQHAQIPLGDHVAGRPRDLVRAQVLRQLLPFLGPLEELRLERFAAAARDLQAAAAARATRRP